MSAVRSERQMNKPNKALRLAAVLLIMTVISTWMLSGMLAKYVSTDSKSDGARVASFDVSTDVTDGVTGQILDIGDKDSSVFYNFTLNNDSEVAVSCDIKVVMDAEVPAGIDMILEDPNGTVTTISTAAAAPGASTKEYVFVSGIKMKPDEHKTGKLTFKPGTVDYVTFTEFATGLVYEKQYDFQVGVKFVQID